VFNRVSNLFSNEKTAWPESDVRHLVTQYLQQQYKTDGVHCEQAAFEQLVIRVNTPALHQAVVLHEVELTELLLKEARFELKKLVVQR
jgi:hypothetical protein